MKIILCLMRINEESGDLDRIDCDGAEDQSASSHRNSYYLWCQISAHMISSDNLCFKIFRDEEEGCASWVCIFSFYQVESTATEDQSCLPQKTHTHNILGYVFQRWICKIGKCLRYHTHRQTQYLPPVWQHAASVDPIIFQYLSIRDNIWAGPVSNTLPIL